MAEGAPAVAEALPAEPAVAGASSDDAGKPEDQPVTEETESPAPAALAPDMDVSPATDAGEPVLVEVQSTDIQPELRGYPD